MKTNPIVLPVLAFILSTSCTSGDQISGRVGDTHKGQERGNGTEYVSLEDRSAWFLESGRPVRYCLELDPAFGIDYATSLKTIRESLKEWSDYYVERSGTGAPMPQPNRISTDFVFDQQCSVDTDLKFVFGGGSPTAAREMNGTNVGVAVRTSRDLVKGWSQGYVWLANRGAIDASSEYPDGGLFPDWNEPSVLKAVVLHEVGHVFGVDHITGTVMDPDLSWSLMAYEDRESAWLLRGIDGYRQLLSKPGGRIGRLGLSPKDDPNFAFTKLGDEAANFEMLVGRKPVGEIAAEFGASQCGSNMSLYISDGVGQACLGLNDFPDDEPSYGNRISLPVFLIAKGEGTGAMYSTSVHGSHSRDLQLTTSAGQTIAVSLLSNEDSAFGVKIGKTTHSYSATSLTLKYLTPTGPRFLFTTSVRSLGAVTTAQ